MDILVNRRGETDQVCIAEIPGSKKPQSPKFKALMKLLSTLNSIQNTTLIMLKKCQLKLHDSYGIYKCHWQKTLVKYG